MKLLSTALLAAGLVALSACGGGATSTDNAADVNAADESLNVPADDLGNLSDVPVDANAVDANAADAAAVDANAAEAAPADANAAQ
jgi:hypothetical protein